MHPLKTLQPKQKQNKKNAEKSIVTVPFIKKKIIFNYNQMMRRF